MTRRRVEYANTTDVQSQFERDRQWVIVIDRKTGTAYSGFSVFDAPVNFLREDVEEFITDEFKRELADLPYHKGVV